MIQLVLSGSEEELQARAAEAMDTVRALYEQFGTLVIPGGETHGGVLEFKCDDGWGNFFWIDWDTEKGLLRARTSKGEELVRWCVGADMRRQLEGFGVYDHIANATWLEVEDDAQSLIEEEERWAARRIAQGLLPERVFIQRPMYLDEPKRLSEHVFEMGSICMKEK